MKGRVFDKEVFGLGSFLNTFLTLVILGLLGASAYYAIYANNQNSAQNTFLWWLEDSIVGNNTELQGFIVSNATAINATVGILSARVTNIENVLNMTENTAIMTINGVTADMMNQNVNLTAGDNIVITPDPLTNSITIDANVPGGGITDITSTDMSITVVTTNSTVDLSNNGVTDLNGMTGMVALLGKDGIEVTSNASSINICAPGITTAIMNLQQEDANQAMQIMAIETKNNEQDMEIEALKTAGMTIQEMLNNTDIDVDMFNMTLLELISQVNMLQMQVDALQMQVDNITAASAPTGTLLPWTGTSANIPPGFLYCDGTQYQIVDYPDLFAVIMTMYGGSGGMFAVPDMRRRVPVGLGGSVFTMQGLEVGDEIHTLLEAEMPSHDHSGSVGAGGNHNHGGSTGTGTPHQHQLWTATGAGAISPGTIGAGMCTDTIPKTMQASNTFGIDSNGLIDMGAFVGLAGCSNAPVGNESSHLHSISSVGTAHGHAIPNSGSGNPHNNVQPSLVVHYMIKT